MINLIEKKIEKAVLDVVNEINKATDRHLFWETHELCNKILKSVMMDCHGAISRLDNFKRISENVLNDEFRVNEENTLNYYINEAILLYHEEGFLEVPYNIHTVKYVEDLFITGYFLAAQISQEGPLFRYQYNDVVDRAKSIGNEEVIMNIVYWLLLCDRAIERNTCVKYYIEKIGKNFGKYRFSGQLAEMIIPDECNERIREKCDQINKKAKESSDFLE